MLPFDHKIIPGLVSLPCQPARGAPHVPVRLLLPFSQTLSALRQAPVQTHSSQQLRRALSRPTYKPHMAFILLVVDTKVNMKRVVSHSDEQGVPQLRQCWKHHLRCVKGAQRKESSIHATLWISAASEGCTADIHSGRQMLQLTRIKPRAAL